MPAQLESSPMSSFSHALSSLPVQIATITGSRMILNTGFRMIYPLLPVFARSLNVELTAIASILAVTQVLGLSAPFIGGIAERYGRKLTILMGMSCFALAMLAVFIFPNLTGLALAFWLGALGKIAVDPAVQAYIGDRVSYERRGLYLGIAELSWSGAFLIGVPIMTWMIATFNWQAPFALLAVLTLVAMAVVAVVLTADRPDVVQHVSFLRAMRVAVNSPMAIAGLVLGFGISGANQLVNVVFGSWIELSFGVQLAALATASAVIGVSELVGEGAVTAFADRFGKRRLIMLGIVGNIAAGLALPFMDAHLTLALIGLFCFYLTFELSLVATLPLATELSPQSRAMYMTVFVVAVTIGRSIITPLAPVIFNYGLIANALIAMGLNLLALIAVWRFIRFD